MKWDVPGLMQGTPAFFAQQAHTQWVVSLSPQLQVWYLGIIVQLDVFIQTHSPTELLIPLICLINNNTIYICLIVCVCASRGGEVCFRVSGEKKLTGSQLMSPYNLGACKSSFPSIESCM